MKTKFIGQFKNGGLNFGEYSEKLRSLARKHDGARVELSMLTPESRKQRGFYHGAVLTLWAFLDGKDYKDNQVIEKMHEVAKIEFNGAYEVVNGRTYKVGATTKGGLRQFVDKVVDYMEENYGIDRKELLDPEDYKKWRDEVFPYGGPDNFISYLVSIGKLKVGLKMYAESKSETTIG